MKKEEKEELLKQLFSKVEELRGKNKEITDNEHFSIQIFPFD